VIADELDSDPRWQSTPYRAQVLAQGPKPECSTPIRSREGVILGTLCLYPRNPASGAPPRQDLIAQVTHIASIAIERVRSEAALKRSEAQLARVTRITTLGALTASIAHEVNQPLSGIITNASTCTRMLAADPPNVEGARETARRMIRDGNRAAEVIARLRALFARKSVSLDTIDLNEAAREVMTLSLTELQGSHVILRSELADNLPTVTGDRVQLQQVMLNLLRNAAEAMSDVSDRRRELTIRTEADGDDRVRLSVKDAGVGLDAQAMERLFQAFYTTKASGMGIGLAISRSIIESHQGRLWATPNDGPGATFSFSIPCRGDEIASTLNLGAIRDLSVTKAVTH
jgi:C4-dicarboxylate-specific signal transduction histidine kinase